MTLRACFECKRACSRGYGHVWPASRAHASVLHRRFASVRQRLPGQRLRTIGFSGDDRGDAWHRDETIGFHSMVKWTEQAVMPRGYPASVNEGYFSYVKWTSLGLVTGRVQSVLATQAALFAVGLGAGAIPLAAAIQWILKDGVGHASAIIYSAAVSTRFDADAKRYRFQAAVAMTIGDFMSIVMPLAPQYFLLIASLSSAINSMAGLAQMASRARIQASFAAQGNLADCARAGQTQAKLMSLVGTATGATFSWLVGSNPLHVLTAMLPLALISLYSVYRSSFFIVLKSINVQRAERIFANLLTQLATHSSSWENAAFSETTWRLRALTPKEVATVETFCFGEPEPIFARSLLLQPMIGASAFGISGWPATLVKGCVPLDAILPLIRSAKEDSWATAWHADMSYAIAVPAPDRCHDASIPIILWFSQTATAESNLQGMWHACVFRHFLNEGTRTSTRALDALAASSWPHVLGALKSEGWYTERVFLDGFGGRISMAED